MTASYDPSSHFEDASTEVLSLWGLSGKERFAVRWKKITGESLDLTVLPEDEDRAQRERESSY